MEQDVGPIAHIDLCRVARASLPAEQAETPRLHRDGRSQDEDDLQQRARRE